MDNVRPDFIAVLVNIVHIKLFRKKCVPLNGNHGIFLAVHIFRIDIHLWSVKRCFSHVLHKRNLQLCQNIPDMLLCLVPDLRLPDVFLSVLRIPFGQMISHIFLHSQCGQAMLCKGDTALKFLHHLIRADHQMSLRNGELTHTGQSVHLSGILVAEQGGSFTHSVRKITV